MGHESIYRNIPEYCYSASLTDLDQNNYSLIPSKYIAFQDRDNAIDFDSEMKRIQQEFKQILAEENETQQQLINAFKGLGYDITI